MNDSNISFLTSEECLELTNGLNCNVTQDPLFILSIVVNAGLLLITSASELMATSKCPFNSLFELITYPCLRKKKENPKELQLSANV
jgi:hypothetical protein